MVEASMHAYGILSHLLVQVFHPNIDLEGNVCLNILREDWKPVLSINSVIYGLQFLFLVSRMMEAASFWRQGVHMASCRLELQMLQ